MKKLITSVIILLSLIPAVAFASSQSATLAGNFHITYNGIEQDFKDGVGKSVTPIVLDGTTYLPVRAVSNIAGLNVNWDQDTKTVSLTSGGAVSTYDGTPSNTKVSSITVNPDSSIVIALNGQKQETPAPFINNGTTYLPVRTVCDMVSVPVGWDATTKTVVLGAKPEDASTGSAVTTPEAVTTPIPEDAKILTDKDMIQLAHKYSDGAFNIESNFLCNPDTQLAFNNDGYKTVTFTVSTNDVGDKHSQDVYVVGRESVQGKGTLLLNLTPQTYGATKTYTVDISSCKVAEIQVGYGMNANAVVSNIYLTK